MRSHLSRGFTLLELAIFLVVLSIIAVVSIPNLREDINAQIINLTAGEIQYISESARLFAGRPDFGNGEWPDQANLCADAINVMLNTPDFGFAGIDQTSPFGEDYETECDAERTFFRISVDTLEEVSGTIANTLPATTVDGATTVTTVPLPATLVALNPILHRSFDISNPFLNQMETALEVQSDPNVPDGFALRTVDQNGNANTLQPVSEQGSINLNDVFLRSVDDFVTNLVSNSFVFTNRVQLFQLDVGDTQTINIASFVNPGDRAVIAIIRIRMEGATPDRVAFNTYTTVVTSGAHLQQAEFSYGCRVGGGADCSGGWNEDVTLFVPLEASQSFQVRVEDGPGAIAREQSIGELVGYIKIFE